MKLSFVRLIFLSILLILVPFVQLGIGYYASVATLIAILVTLVFIEPIIRGLLGIPFIWIAITFMIVPLAIYSNESLYSNSLRLARESLFLLILVGGIRGFEASGTEWKCSPPMTVICTILLALLGLVILQTFMLAKGSYVGIPADYFIMGAGTIADDLDLRFNNNGSLRPSATFSEPSYLGFVILCLGMAVAYTRHKTARIASLSLIIVIAILSRSMAIILGGALVYIVPKLRPSIINTKDTLGLILVLVIGLPAFAILGGSTAKRLIQILSGGEVDASTNIRLIAPLVELPSYISTFPVGLPTIELLRKFDQLELSLDNAFLLFFYQYGVLAVPILLIIFSSTRDVRTRVFLMVCLFFNGVFFSADKVALILIGLAFYNGGRSEISRQLLAKRFEATPTIENV